MMPPPSPIRVMVVEDGQKVLYHLHEKPHVHSAAGAVGKLIEGSRNQAA